jgi:hypothetical protein
MQSLAALLVFAMSEWYDNQNKSSSNFRELLQERIEKANPRSNLTAIEAKRLAKLEVIADKLKRGENVQNRHLQAWLNEEECAQIEAEWQEQQALRETLKDKPSDLKRYEEKLKEAIMMRNRSEAYHRKGNKSAAYKLDSKCKSLCEDALEILQEIVQYDASLQIWFDRELDFGHGSLIDASIGNLPRIVTSRSIDKKRGDIRLASKQSVKLAVVERAMHNIGRDAAPASKPTVSKLDKFLNVDV